MSQDRPKLDVQIQRYGALGLLEMEDELRDATDDAVIEIIRRQLDTMTPLDTAVIAIGRQRT